MAVTTEFTQTQVDAITRAIALGVLEVEHNGKRTRYQSLQSMLDLRDKMKSEIAAAAGSIADPVKPMASMTRPTIFCRT